MDPITHGLLGAATAGTVLGRRLGAKTLLLGAAAGMAPDLDVLIGYGHDHLNGLIYHRHFTHAIAFVPVGAAVIAGLVWAAAKLRWPKTEPRPTPMFLPLWLIALLGMFTHGLLDCTTSYGTLWLWPLSDHRVAWDIMAIVDPVVTSLLLIGVLAGVFTLRSKIRRRAWPVGLMLGLTLAYFGLGVVQHARAKAAQGQLAAARGQMLERGRVLPTLGNLVVWRSVYVSQGKLYADALRVGWRGPAMVREGGAVDVFTAAKLPPAGDAARAAWLARDFARFNWFADGYLAQVPGNPAIIGDMRYALPTPGLTPLWGMYLPELGPAQSGSIESGVGLVVHLHLDRSGALRELWREIRGREPAAPVSASLGQTH